MIAARLMWYITIASAIVGLFNDVVRAGAGASILHRLQLAIVFRDVSRLASEMAPRWHRDGTEHAAALAQSSSSSGACLERWFPCLLLRDRASGLTAVGSEVGRTLVPTDTSKVAALDRVH